MSFAAGQSFEQVVIGQSANFLRALAEALERWAGKDSAALLQAVERGEGNAVSAIEVVKGFKEFGFELMVGARTR